jgi:hypothetical protein
MGLSALIVPPLATKARATVAGSEIRAAAAATLAAQHAAEAPPQAMEAPAIAPADRADATLDRESLNPIKGGFVAIPASFASADGAYALVIHFHGLNKVVEESFEHAGLNAVVATINLGTGSGAYSSQLSNRWALPAILQQTQATLQKRGLRGAMLRRLALSAFSAGYGALRGILEQPALADHVDAVLLLDGIHAGYLPNDHSLDLARLMPFARFAEKAASGKKLFSITHSEIIPNADYASTHESTDALLALLHIERGPAGEAPAVPALPSIANVAKLIPLVPLSEAHQGAFHVRGYAGTQKADHVMHLAQMGETAVPDLVRYWSETTTP